MRKELSGSRQNLEEIGELLFELLTADISEAQRQMGWMIFEKKLGRYYSKRKNVDSRSPIRSRTSFAGMTDEIPRLRSE